ncbi:MAG TPA: ethanolamine ammonia lyase-activating protein [Chloroflexota bacterium]
MTQTQPEVRRRYQRGVDTPYQKWQAGEGIPVHKGSAIPDLYNLELDFWPRMGQKAAFANLADQEYDDGWVIEIAPRGQTEVQHHVFESSALVLEGRGATTFWQPGKPKQTVEWQRGSLFATPLNCHYQHFNLDGDKPARLWAVGSLPMMLNSVRDEDFIFNNPYVFRDRYDGEENYFTDAGAFDGRSWRTNFVPDVRSFQLRGHEGDEYSRGMGVQSIQFILGRNSMQCHISQWPSGTYKKAHCHGVGAHVTILNGHGFTLLWSEGVPYQRIDWKDGTVLCPREGEYHQHFNTGSEPCSFLALRMGELDWKKVGGEAIYKSEYRVGSDSDQGGIPYELEDPWIYEAWLQDCKKNGVDPVLPRPAYVNGKG